MMELSHASVGAAIGSEIKNPYVVVVLSIIAHFVMDKIPHFWPQNSKNQVLFVIFGYTLTLLFLIYILKSSLPNKTNILIGASTGVLVDTIINGISYIRKSKLGLWHSKRQPHNKNINYLFAELIFASAIILLLASIL